MSSSKTSPYSYQFLLILICKFVIIQLHLYPNKIFSFIYFLYQKENIQEQKEMMNVGGKQPKILDFLFCFKTLM